MGDTKIASATNIAAPQLDSTSAAKAKERNVPAGVLGAESSIVHVNLGTGKKLLMSAEALPPPTKDLNTAIDELDTFFKNGDIGELMILVAKEINKIRAAYIKQKAMERQHTLELAFKSADDIREAGKEQAKAAFIAGVAGIAAGAVSIGSALGSGTIAEKFKNEAEIAKKTAGMELGQKNEQILKIGQSFQTRVETVASGFSTASKSAGEGWSGSMQTSISEANAQSKQDDALSQAAAGRADNAQKIADDLLQQILKLVDTFMQLRNTINQTATNISNKIA